MGRKLFRLTAKAIEKKSVPGYYADGGGLYLQVAPAGTKSWIFRYALSGRPREMGLGSLNAVSLAQARAKAQDCRGLLVEGVDPIAARDAKRTRAKLEEARAITFRDAAERYIKAKREGWGNAKHATQWENTLATYAYPTIGSLAVADVDTGLIVRVLEPIWTAKPETASRVRGRIEAILDWARVRGYRQGENPGRLRGHLEHLLPEQANDERHHAALPYEEIGAFVAELRKREEAVAARALEFAILTATRTGEVIGAKPAEFDLEQALWIVPAERMKGRKGKRREHRVPLSPRVVEIVREQLKAGGDYVFPLSNMAMLMLLRRMGRSDLTVHGLRSTFKDWASERTAFPNIVSEAALAHGVKDKAEAAYRRGTLFAKRQQLMNAWAAYCDQAKGKVLPLRESAA